MIKIEIRDDDMLLEAHGSPEDLLIDGIYALAHVLSQIDEKQRLTVTHYALGKVYDIVRSDAFNNTPKNVIDLKAIDKAKESEGGT